jgi:hypothetical protein
MLARGSPPIGTAIGAGSEVTAVSYAAMRRELAGGTGLRLRTRFWRRLLIRWRFLPMVLKER